MNNFSMNQGSHNNAPTSPHTPRDGNSNGTNNGSSSTNHHHRHQHCHAASAPALEEDPSMGTRLTSRNPALDSKLKQMALPLAPLVQLTSGHVHPAFPSTLLSFWLLTDEQLDQIAHFYHQRTPCQWTRHYPCPITWGEGLTVEEKRRKIGKFIGLRGVSFYLFSNTSFDCL